MLDLERGTFLKKWTGRHPVALIYPNHYQVGMSSLGYQLVYALLNKQDDVVCERFFLPRAGEKFQSVESGRGIDQFPILFFSISFEHDYLNLVRIVASLGTAVYAEDREPQVSTRSPLIVCGGVATFINPEPLAPFVDLFFLGEAEAGLVELTGYLNDNYRQTPRKVLLRTAALKFGGCYPPSLYTPKYDENGCLIDSVPEQGLSKSVRRVFFSDCQRANHSQLLTPETEFSELFLTELGRGCSEGCRFCTAGFIYRPPRLWNADAVVAGLEEKFAGVKRVGLLGMEMMEKKVFEKVSEYLTSGGCALSFSSLRADRIDGPIVDVLKQSDVKNVTIAPDGSSERLRRVINKGLDEHDILTAAARLVEAEIFKIKVYLMIGLPTETDDDLNEAINLIGKIRRLIDPIGKKRGRLSEIGVSVNCFAPKPWTPFQFHVLGGGGMLAAGQWKPAAEVIKELKRKQKLLRQGLANYSNVTVHFDKPENVLFQTVLAKGDRRVAKVLRIMAEQNKPWKQAMKLAGLKPETFAITASDADVYFPWDIVDHGITKKYLWLEYQKAFKEQLSVACNVAHCRRCGVCND